MSVPILPTSNESLPAQNSNLVSNSSVQSDPIHTEQRILELCTQNPEGINDLILQHHMPQVTAQQRLAALNRLLSLGKLDLLKSSQLGIVYRLKDNLDPSSLMTSNSDMDEKLVYTIIKESGNKGIWVRDISIKTNVKSTALNKTLKSLETKKLIKSVPSVNANKKKVYMLFDIEPDRTITGGAWYSGKEFESEFVEILNEQCYYYLKQLKEKTCENKNKLAVNDPLTNRTSSYATIKEIRDYIKNLGISKVELGSDDIETILNTLVYDGKVEKNVMASTLGSASSSVEHVYLYRAVDSIISATKGSSFVRMPCGICPLIDNCHVGAVIQPLTCVYMKEWLEF
jgi:DNA-directed RNA polymerase III subunit RPC6